MGGCFVAEERSTTAGSTWYSTSTSSAASLACASVSATTTATWSPTWRTLPCARHGCGGSFIGWPVTSVMSQPQGRPPTLASAKSWPVKMPSTPLACFAFSREIFFILAWACGDRTNAGVRLVGQRHVVGVLSGAGEEAVVFLARYARADEGSVHNLPP